MQIPYPMCKWMRDTIYLQKFKQEQNKTILASTLGLTYWGLVTPYADKDLGQH